MGSGAGINAEARGVRLRGWKAIGRHFGVDERTVKRWEATRGLPVHRMPGEPRAPVFAYVEELETWVEGSHQPECGLPGEVTTVPAAPARKPGAVVLLLALLLMAAGLVVWMGVQAARDRKLAAERTEELKRLAVTQVAALNDQLDSPRGSVAMRGRLAAEAIKVLGDVAEGQGSSAKLRREAAEGFRRLAVLQNSIDRPSLRDRAAARLSLTRGMSILEADPSPEGRRMRARLLIEAARQAAGAGSLPEADRLLAEAKPVALASDDRLLEEEWWIAASEVAGWKGEHREATTAAAKVVQGAADDTAQWLRQVKALELEGEARFYLGEIDAARALYARARSGSEAALARWPADQRIQWARLRQYWNEGSTLLEAGEPSRAEPLLREGLAGWEALALSDPTDLAVQAWVRALRLSLGQALVQAGKMPDAIAELSRAVAERRQWHDASPRDPDRRRMLMKGEVALAEALSQSGRTAEACLLYTEARRMTELMARDGQLTAHDATQSLRDVRAGEAKDCGDPDRP